MQKEESPVLKVGIISDVQSYAFEQDWGMHNCIKAFEMLAEMDIDVLVNAGDIGDFGEESKAIEYYQKMVEKHFPRKMPIQVNCAGNHDFWTKKNSPLTSDYVFARFQNVFHDPVKNPFSKTIAGYDFISFASDNKNNYSEKFCDSLKDEIQKSVARDPHKPIFVITHFQPKDTCSGSLKDGRSGLRRIMNEFPQVVSLSGHTHCPLEDERCIWQGEFTAINTSTLSYGCIEENCANLMGPILPFGREVIQMMYMEIYRDRLEIHRYNVEDGREIKPDNIWKVSLPYKPEEAVYTDKRALFRNEPEFPSDTKIYFRIDYGFVYLVFNEAKHDDFVHFYKLVFTEIKPDGTERKPMEYLYVANFYRLLKNQDPRYVFRLPPHTLEAAKTYRFDVYPIETFGKTGKPISLTASVPEYYTF